MVSWWPGDGNANDIIGGDNGTLVGGVTFAPGEVGQAFSFDGATGYVSVPDSPSLRLGTSDFTIDFWLNTTQIPPNYGWLLWKTSCPGPCLGWAISQRNDNNTVDIQVCDNVFGCQEWRTQTAVNDGHWHLVALTRAGMTLNAYLDGQDNTVVETNPGIADPTQSLPLLVGTGITALGTSFYNGQLDEIEIFNRAISAQEILAIYNAGSAGKCKSLPGLTVTSMMDIYQAGGYQDHGGGTAPANFTIQPGTIPALSFSSITGLWNCNTNAPEYGPDGTATTTCNQRAGRHINPIGPFSGYTTTDFTGALVGMFLADTFPTSRSPTLQFYATNSSQGGTQTNFPSLSPALGQVFFIGDGLTGTGTGAAQSFNVPPTATHLYLGYVDSCDGRVPGCYGDNLGSVNITFSDSCGFSISPTSQSFGASGGSGNVIVTTLLPPFSCPFSPSSNASWITFSHQCPGGGSCPYYPPSFEYSVAPNTGPTPRSGTLTVAGQTVTVTQSGAGTCTYTINPTGQTFSESGGRGTVNVGAPAGCAWSAISNISWVTISTGSSGSGNGPVTFNVTANSGPPRTGTLTIAGQTYAVTQSASGCGATDVSNKIKVQRNALLPFGIPPEVYTQTISLINTSSQPISGPIYLVMDGLPRTGYPCTEIGVTNPICNVTPPSAITFCQSPAGSDLVLFSPGAMTSGQTVSGALTFVPGPFGGGEASGFSYTTRVFSGTPSQ
jgi:hypothetical protein